MNPHFKSDTNPASNSSGGPKWKTYTFWGLIVASIGLIVVSPFDSTLSKIKQVGPWVGGGLAVSESLFILGLALLAWSAGVNLGANPFKWKSHTQELLAKLDRTPLFWVGLAINTVGAVGTGLVLAVGVVAGLPWQSWGLLTIPVADLAVTVSLRSVIFSGVRSH